MDICSGQKFVSGEIEGENHTFILPEQKLESR